MKTFADWCKEADQHRDFWNLWLEDHEFPVRIDEMSVLYYTTDQLGAFVQLAKEAGMEHFNGVDETNHVRNDGTFKTRFEFLRFPDEPWRIEAMCITGGTSPIHGPLKAGDHVHASFKVDDLDEFDDALEALDEDPALVFIAMVENGYGKFAYYQLYRTTVRPFLKVRVNTRDR